MRKASYLTVLETHLLDHACGPIREAFQSAPYLVGSATERADYRDVDVRLILSDEEYDRLTVPEWTMIGHGLTAYLRAATGLPIDFQVQRRTEANERHPGGWRSALGIGSITDFRGDGAPTKGVTR